MNMNPFDPILFRELPVIQKIIQDETWLEGERRGCSVDSDDRVVRENVCRIILRVGQQLRDSFGVTLEHGETNAVTGTPASVTHLPIPDAGEAI